MGFSLETTNYKLGQYAGTDKPNYTTDYNENMAKIDTALKAVSDAGGATNTDLGETKDRVSALETNVAKNTEDIASVTTAAAQNARDIVSANSEIEALQTKDTELEGDVTNVKNQLETIPEFDIAPSSLIEIVETGSIVNTSAITIPAHGVAELPCSWSGDVTYTNNGGAILLNTKVNAKVLSPAAENFPLNFAGISIYNPSGVPSVGTHLARITIVNPTDTEYRLNSINMNAKILLIRS